MFEWFGGAEPSYPDEIDDEDDRPDIIDRATGRARRLTEMCASCIMRAPADGQIHLRVGRLRAFIADVRAKDSYVVCHSTLYRADVDPSICRGYADRYDSNYLRVMGRLGGFLDVPPPPEREVPR